MASVIVVLMCGIPGAGKSTFAAALRDCLIANGWGCSVIDYDAIVPEENWNEASYALVRTTGLQRLSEQIAQAKAAVGPQAVIVDDNMHLTSMRREAYCICRDRGLPMMVVWCNTDRGICSARNERRLAGRVADRSFSAVASAFEGPDPKHIHDRSLVIVDGHVTDDINLSRVMAFMQDSMTSYQPHAVPHHPISSSGTHWMKQLDERIRKITSSIIQRSSDKRALGELLCRIKAEVLATARTSSRHRGEEQEEDEQLIDSAVGMFVSMVRQAVGENMDVDVLDDALRQRS